jgi:hypothetical protein
MGAINTAAYLATIRSRMDAQQQIVALLENELQKSILGDTGTKVDDLMNAVDGKIFEIYDAAGINKADQMGFKAGIQWRTAMDNASTNASGDPDAAVDQDFLRQALYQARALLGELRIEEQAWNGEVNSEKTLRKDVNDFAKV